MKILRLYEQPIAVFMYSLGITAATGGIVAWVWLGIDQGWHIAGWLSFAATVPILGYVIYRIKRQNEMKEAKREEEIRELRKMVGENIALTSDILNSFAESSQMFRDSLDGLRKRTKDIEEQLRNLGD